MKGTNTRGTLTFATSGPDSRTTQLFINLKDNARLVEGMKVVDEINAEYRERPDQGEIHARGNDYLKSEFPNLDSIKTARIVKADAKP